MHQPFYVNCLYTCDLYLGRKITLSKENQTADINRRKRLALVSLGTFSFILKNKNKKNCGFDHAFFVRVETRTLPKQIVYKLRSTQRAIERQILGVTWRNHKRNTWIGQTTNIKHVTETIARS